MWFAYILFCDQKTYYVGISNNFHRRLKEHKKGESRFTRQFSDIQLVYLEKLKSKKQAEIRERQIKGWSNAKKKALIDGNLHLLKKLSRSSELVEV